MVSILVLVFFAQLGIHLLSTLGSSTISSLLWTIYSKIPNPQSKQALDVKQLRKDVVDLNRQMNNTSAQDDFAKWAKLRRQHDKKKDEYDKKSRELQDFRTNFDRAASILRWVGTTGIRYLLQYWFSKQAMFWLPRGWVPHPVEWIVSFPSAPLGSISVNLWWIACATVIGLVSEGVTALWALRKAETVSQPATGTKARAEAPSAAAEPVTTQSPAARR